MREWAHTKLVGARVDFSAGRRHGFCFKINVQESRLICTCQKRSKPSTGLILWAILLLGNSDIAENKHQDRYSGYDEFKSFFGNFLIDIILPFLHFGQQLMSMPVNRSIISPMVSLIFSGNVASGSINFLISGICSFLFV